MSAAWYQWKGQILTLNVSVQPRASCNEVVGVQGERLKVRVVCAPTGGEANQCLIRMMAKAFRVPRSAITLQMGEHSREKRLAVHSPRDLPVWLPAR